MGDGLARASPRLPGTRPHILGKSNWARLIRKEIAKIAPRSSTVLVTGPTGTGKELIARCLHAESARRERPFVPVDCATISGPLCASQLFGHVRGAFTGADYAVLGCFRAADGGTIFLDEVGELEPQIQSTLLRVIQERTVVPVGGHKEIPVDVRIVAATNRKLDVACRVGQFRQDLYYRLNVVSLETIPLAQRLDDIHILARHFLEQLAAKEGLPSKRLSPEGCTELLAHDWPGNVRELQNVLERAAVMADGDSIGPGLLRLGDSQQGPPPIMRAAHPVTSRSSDSAGVQQIADSGKDQPWPTLAEQESEHIARTLELTGNNQSAAARLLDIDRHVLARKMKKYGFRKPPGTF